MSVIEYNPEVNNAIRELSVYFSDRDIDKPIICIGVLNWGLGHASRCISIIRECHQQGFKTLIASDGIALELLQKTFPDNEFLELPGYKVKYYTHSILLNIFINSHHIIKAIYREQRVLDSYLENHTVAAVIISDSRPGFFSKSSFNIFITHQINMPNGSIIEKLGFRMMISRAFKNYREIWIPDDLKAPGLAGELSHPFRYRQSHRYIGALSRFIKCPAYEEPKNSVLIVLSGPEPQRSILEELIWNVINDMHDYRFTIVRGINKIADHHSTHNHISVKGLVGVEALQQLFCNHALVICRSGYSSIMDLHVLNKHAILIPTPGQSEQLYLASLCKLMVNRLVLAQDEISMHLNQSIREYLRRI
jgi:UDP:flavonoid glycosyltransferase YjiC (YdhE family)